MGNITYIIGGRQTGKTTRLLEMYRKDPHGVLFVMSHAMARSRLFRGDSAYSARTTAFTIGQALRGYETVYCDEFNHFPRRVQTQILESGLKIVATISPEVVNLSDPPPFWMYMPQSERHVLTRDISGDDFAVYNDLQRITDIYGYFIIKP